MRDIDSAKDKESGYYAKELKIEGRICSKLDRSDSTIAK